MCAQRTKKGETPHPLKEEKARIRARRSLVSFYHRASDIRGEEDMECIFSKEMCMVYQNPVCKRCCCTQWAPEKSSQCFPGGKRSLKKQKSKAIQLSEDLFTENALSARAEAWMSEELHGGFLSHGNTFDVYYDNLEGCQPSPMQEESRAEMDKCFCNWMCLTWYAPTTHKASSQKSYLCFPKTNSRSTLWRLPVPSMPAPGHSQSARRKCDWITASLAECSRDTWNQMCFEQVVFRDFIS